MRMNTWSCSLLRFFSLYFILFISILYKTMVHVIEMVLLLKASLFVVSCMKPPQLKVYMIRIFCFINFNIRKSNEEWHLFYCNSILGCQVIQDSCKLEDR